MSTLRSLRNFALFVLMLGGASISHTADAQPGMSITFQTFYDELSPYGRWSRNPQYGSVWIPDVPSGFQPYSTNGYWEVTEYGNTWVSEYDWGWAPFHYGRWSYDDYMGWFWIPDYEWGPAWVNWRSGGGYYGWAPLGPGMHVNMSINLPSFWWVFVPQRYITSPRWHSYCPPRRRVTHVYNQTVIINNYYRSNNRTYVYGPRRDEIERVTRRSVPIRTIDASPSGRGRVVVAESNRRGDRYDRNEPTRRGSVVDANPRGREYDNNRGRDDNRRIEAPDNNRGGRVERPDYDSRGNRGDDNNRSNRSETPDFNNRGSRNERIDNSPRTAPEPRDNSRFERNRNNERPSFENRSERVERSNPSPQPERSNRSSEPSNRGRGSFESPSQRPSRVERAPSEPRSNRAPEGNSGRNGGERSSRGPR